MVAGVVAVLAALPSLAGLLPASASAPPDLLRRVQQSQTTGWSGLGESTGALALPDVRELSGLPELLGATTRTRVWWRGPTAYRVDVVRPTGETDVVVDPAGSWTWDSADARAVRLQGQPPVRLPQAPDLVAPVL
ncbi:MAG: Sigma regulatory protein MucB/RseB, partial [Frankiales bacterium]|nr:Sigma regulatory protein MucB/RseB [Frankiales bacterium]